MKNSFYMAKQTFTNPDYQRIPPQALEVEEAVIGAIMIEPGSDIGAIEILSPDSFYKEGHRRIFKAILDLSTEHLPIDQLTVVQQLQKNGDLDFIGGAAYINYLASKVGSAAHLDFHTKIIAEKYIKRELISISTKIQDKSYDPSSDIESLLEFSEKQIFDLAMNNISTAIKPINAIMRETLDKLEELSKRSTTFSGTPSGFTQLDRITSGWQASDLIIIAARPSMGKTAFILSMARNMSLEHNVPVALFSLEMSSQQIVTRLLISESEIEATKLRTGKLAKEEWQILEAKSSVLSQAPIYIDDTPAITLTELRAKARNLKLQYNIQLIIIDYLQLMSGTSDTKNSREQEVSQISRGLKAIAKELNIPIIALSQLNRAVENRKGFRPQLSDLRESGAIEQDADIVIFIHRPEKFLPPDTVDESIKGLAEIIIAKHRNGAVTEVNLKFIDRLAKFVDYDQDISFSGLPQDELTFSSKMNLEDFDETFHTDFNHSNSTPF